jgi:hypothetical protein
MFFAIFFRTGEIMGDKKILFYGFLMNFFSDRVFEEKIGEPRRCE